MTPHNTRSDTGSVVALWRYPVKSMLGEELNAIDVTDRGVLGDRAYALIDASTGKVASAKNPAKWGQLFHFQAAFIEPPRVGVPVPSARITFPDGTVATSEQRDINEILSKVLGREVTLETVAPENLSFEEYWPDIDGLPRRNIVTDESMPPGTFFDGAVVHVLTTATIDHLRELYPQGRFEIRRFRPNIVVAPTSGEKGFVENDWIGHELRIGDEVHLNITRPCPRCVMTTLPQGDLPKDPGILRAVAQHNELYAGVYAAVLQGGTIRRGDPVTLEQDN